MDPLHLTEFASDRYFEKLNQTREAQAPGASSSQQKDGHALEGSIPQGPFILPLRGSHAVETEEVVSKPVEQKVKEKSRFLSFRSRILHSKAQTQTQPGTEHVERRPSVAESTKQRYGFCRACYA
jgi:hypothetical protein